MKEHTPGQNTLGAYFTPKPLAQWITSMALQLHQINPPPKKSALHVVDPAAGDGIFLRSLGKIVSQQNTSNLKMRFVGWEVQKNIAKKASLSLQQMIQTEKLSNPLEITYKIKHGDGLLHLLQTPDHYDLILGNPPYMRQETLAPEEKERLVNLLKETIPNLPQTFSKQADYYIYFIFAAIQSLVPGGVLGFLISTSWMNTKFGLGLREWLLTHFKGKIMFAHSPEQRLYPTAKINTMVLFVQKPLKSDKTPQISLEVWDLRAPKQKQATQSYTILKRPITPEILQQNVNWETVLFRCPPNYFPIHAQFAPFLLPLSHFAKVATGIYTGLNSFYYISKNQENPTPPQRPDDRFLVSVIRTPKEVSTWQISPAQLSTHMFLCRETKATLTQSYPKTLKYIHWGSHQTTEIKQKVMEPKFWPEVASVRNRKPGWWALPKSHGPTTVFMRYIYYQNKMQPMATTPIFSDRCYHQIYPNTQVSSRILSLVLNFQITQLLIEILGRNTLGQGALKLETMMARQLPILACFDLPLWSALEKTKERRLTLAQLPAIEVKVYEQLGIAHPKKVYDEIRRIHQELVDKRVNKARSL